MPRTFQDNYLLNPTANFGMADPSLRTPYVQQWNIGIQRDVRGFVLEARYIGNHGTKLLRAIDLNQININAGGFLQDFIRAQANGNLALTKTGVFNPAYDSTISGSQVLTVFPLMPGGGTLTNSTNRTLQQGAVADMAFNYQSTKANGPINFLPNPYAASLRYHDELLSNSTYNGAQFEFRTRDHHGLTSSKGTTPIRASLSDADSGSDNNNQGRYEPLMDNNNPKLEKARDPIRPDPRHEVQLCVPAAAGHRPHAEL